MGQNRVANSDYPDLGADLQINPQVVLYACVNYQAFTNGDQLGYQGGVIVKFENKNLCPNAPTPCQPEKIWAGILCYYFRWKFF